MKWLGDILTGATSSDAMATEMSDPGARPFTAYAALRSDKDAHMVLAYWGGQPGFIAGEVRNAVASAQFGVGAGFVYAPPVGYGYDVRVWVEPR